MKTSLNKKLVPLAALCAATFFAQAVQAQTTVSGSMTVDNAFITSLGTNGTQQGAVIAAGDDWTVAYPVPATALTPGMTNYLQVQASNTGGQAMFVGDFSLSDNTWAFGNSTQALSTGTDWQVSNAGFAGPYQAAVVVSDNGTSGLNDGTTDPWGKIADISDGASFIWYAADYTPAAVIFSAEIVPVAADLSVTSVTTQDSVLAGSGAGNMVVTLTASNLLGPAPATGVEVDLSSTMGALPAGVTLDSAVPDLDFNAVSNIWTVGDLAYDASEQLVLTFTVDYTVQECTDCLAVGGTISGDQTDQDDTNDTASDTTDVVAASSLTSFFNTTISFTDGSTDTVAATLSCNAGIPLMQSGNVSAAVDLTFNANALPFTTPGTTCEITLDDLDSAYTAIAVANNSTVAASCVYVVGAAGLGEAPFAADGNNTCAFAATLGGFTYEVTKVWDDPEDTLDSNVTAEVDVECVNVWDGNNLTTEGDTFYFSYGDRDSDDEETEAYMSQGAPNPDTSADAEVTSCTATEVNVSSAQVSDDMGCETPTVFEAGGDSEQGCSIVNTVVYEGIPTLSQYGMAIMALLMLGLGFVGFRRFI